MCPMCGERFENRHMKRHLEEVHGNKKEEPCPTCGQVYQRKADRVKQSLLVLQNPILSVPEIPKCSLSSVASVILE